MEIQKIFSDMYDEERLYSVLLTEDEMALYQSMFSDEAEGALVGGGAAAATLGTAAGIGYGAKHAKDALTAKRKVALGDAQIASEKARENFKVQRGLAKGNKAYEKEVAKAEKQLDKAYRKLNRLGKEGNLEKGARKVSELAKKAGEHKGKLAIGAAALTTAGAAAGAYAKHRKSSKN